MTKSLADEQKLYVPFLDVLKENNTDKFQNTQIVTGKSTFKLQHTIFDQAFHQMIVDTSQNGISAADSVQAAADKVNGILNPVTTPSS
jgi:hypothetical protein